MPPKPPHQNHGGTEPKKKKPFYEDLQDGKYIADGIIDVVCKATSLCFDRGTSIPVLTTDFGRDLGRNVFAGEGDTLGTGGTVSLNGHQQRRSVHPQGRLETRDRHHAAWKHRWVGFRAC